ncbi:MAG: DEAD/DEAH box helicase [Bacteriovoracaceae bacterium]
MNSSDSSLNWNDLGLSPELLELIQKAGYVKPSPVQAQAIPLVLEGSDILVSSQTGSGKTAAFVLPIIEKFKNKNGTYILALAPTREIAQQTGAVFESFAAAFGLKTAVCIGGASLSVEKAALASSPHIIIATPGRLCDHLERGNVWLDFIQCLVFDEADRMLDMGFAKQIQIISEQIPKERQTLMFSATFAPSVEKLANQVMINPKKVMIEKKEGSVPKIEEHLFWMEEGKKLSALMQIIREDKGSIIVFVNAKDKVYRLWRSINNEGFKGATYMHSDITQEQREAAVADFKSGKFNVLIATDVMGRGIDVDDVAHVVNFDIPRVADDYVHRIGRTGRRGKTGVATSFAIPVKDEMYIRAIEKMKGLESPPIQPKRVDQGHRGHKQKQFQNKPMPPKRQHLGTKVDPVMKQEPTPSPISIAVAEAVEETKKVNGVLAWIKGLFQ